MRSIQEILKLSIEFLQKRQVVAPRRDVEEIISHVTGLKRMDLYMKSDCPIEEKELEKIRDLLTRRAKGEPLGYLLEEVEFFGCRFKISKDVLIPRQETEILVSKVAEELKTLTLENKVLLDLCTGSGCIGISLKKKFPTLKVVLSDLSPEALKVAEYNAKLNGVEVEILEGDLFEPFIHRKADFIVSNPPYISQKEFETLDPEVKNYEPKRALIGGVTGLEFYEIFAKTLKQHLNPQGKVWLEMGYAQGSQLLALFHESGFPHVKVEKDWSGHDRFFVISP